MGLMSVGRARQNHSMEGEGDVFQQQARCSWSWAACVPTVRRELLFESRHLWAIFQTGSDRKLHCARISATLCWAYID